MKFILTLTLILATFTGAFSQVQVDQSFVDSAYKSFIEVQALRELDSARQKEIQAKDDLIKSQANLIDALKQLNEVNKEEIKALRKIKCESTSFLWSLIKVKRCG